MLQTSNPEAAERDWAHDLEGSPFRRTLRPSSAELLPNDADGTVFLGRAGCAAFGQDKARVRVPRDLAPEGSPHHNPDAAYAWAREVHKTRDRDAVRTLRRATGADDDAPEAEAGGRGTAWAHDDNGQERADCQDALATLLRVGGPDVRALLLALAPEATGAEAKDDGRIETAIRHRNRARSASLDDARTLAYGWQGRVAARLGISRHALARRLDNLRRDFGAYVHASTILGRGVETRDACAC